jgi:DNA topoisomerase-1
MVAGLIPARVVPVRSGLTPPSGAIKKEEVVVHLPVGHTLVIVESPTKARTIRGFLPKDFRVEASMGHVRDLPNNASEIPAAHKGEKWANLGVNTANDFEPLYVVPKDKKKVVKELKEALKGADQLLLATDEDREGESISWHLMELLTPKVPVKRMVFHEITKEAIGRALEQTRELVHAQETRRILDRLVGYTLSPLLWKKVAWGLSAGRVQSVAVRLIVQRERARRAFRSGSYWDLKAQLNQGGAFEAKLSHLKGERIAGGSDFDENTGGLKAGSKVRLLSEAEARQLREAVLASPWRVAAVEEKPTLRKPVAPFTTSTLQQEANRKLRLSARETMRTAQGLYERGFITYMRTDSVHLSDQAINAARSCVQQKYGPSYLSPGPRQFSTKARNAQEAHEAIRPSGESFRDPSATGLDGRDLALYDLIWKRTVASQMADARLTMLSVDLEVDGGAQGLALFRASGKRIDFAGFFRAYVEGSDDPDAALEGQEVLLPSLKAGDSPACKGVEALGHQTQPPARYSEAALVKMLEKEGIGRPSTYASIIGTIVDRGYATLQNNALTPSFTAFAVTALLEEHFPDLVDTGFTARMENTLDEISHGQVQWLPYLESFYKGDQGLENQVAQREGDIDPGASRTVALEGLPCVVRIGRFGAYLETKRVADDGSEELLKATLPQEVTPADLDAERAELILRQKSEGPEALGTDPETGEEVYLLFGQYGPYLQRGQVSDENPKPKRASLPKGVKPEAMTLEEALGLLRLPRQLGEHPDGGRIEAGLGRFGPYVVHHKGKGEKDYRSLKADDDVLAIGLSRAVELLAMPKRGRGGRTALKDLGSPDGGELIQVFDGPYGLYVKQGKVNASLPEGTSADTISLEQAVELLAARAASGKGKGKGRGAAAAKTPSARKAPATTKTGRLRASAVRVIRPADS